jgi:hypothetical protein
LQPCPTAAHAHPANRFASTTPAALTAPPHAAGCALHGLRRSVLPPDGLRLPARQQDPRVERACAQGPLAGGVGPAARDKQLPGVHGPRVPRAVRGLVCARHQPEPRDDQDNRADDLRQGLGVRLDDAQATGVPQWQDRLHRRLGPRRPRCRRPAQQSGPQRDRLRAQRPHWRPHDVRRAEHEDGQGGRRAAARRPHGRGGRQLRHQRARRQERRPEGAALLFGRARARGRRDEAAQPADRGPRGAGRALRDGIPARGTRTAALAATLLRCSPEGLVCYPVCSWLG